MLITCDIEGDNLLDGLTKIWCLVVEEHATGKVRTFVRDEDFRRFNHLEDEGVSQHKLSSFEAYLESSEDIKIVGHNFLGYDAPAIKKILGFTIPESKIIDTLVLSRLYNTNNTRRPYNSYNKQGQVLSTFYKQKRHSHSLDSWGKTLNFPKGNFHDFSKFSRDMLDYCIQDVKLNTKVYQRLQVEGRDFSDLSKEIEFKAQGLLNQQERDGFYLDLQKAQILCVDIEEKRDEMLESLQSDFPPVKKTILTFKPRFKKEGGMFAVDEKRIALENCEENEDGSYTTFMFQVFNPRSSDQVISRMNNAGWNPTKFGKLTAKQMEHNSLVLAKKKEGVLLKPKPLTGKEGLENYDTLPDDAPQSAKNIGTYKLLESRISTVKGWFNAMGEDGRVHGGTISIGAWSQRCSHREPNMANIPKPKKYKQNENGIWVESYEGLITPGINGKFTYDMRDCFTVADKESRCVLGVDAEGIQLRALAHYMGDEDFIKAVAEGRKEDKTDIHNFNLTKTNGLITDRDIMKTWIYAFLLGGGDFKLGVIMKAPRGRESVYGAKMRQTFLSELPALAELIKKAHKAAEVGYMIGLDGRLVPIPSAHHALTAYLQSFEAIIMKYAMIIKEENFKKENLDVIQVAFVHDEWQHDCLRAHAKRAGEIACDALTEVGEKLGSKIIITGSQDVGDSWSSSH